MKTTRHEIESSKLARLVADIEAVELRASDCRRLPLVEIMPSGRIEIVDGFHRIAGMIAAGETSIPCLTCDDEDLVAAAANAEDTVAQAEALAAIYGKTNNARQAAEQIIATYDSHDQMLAVADRGCGEWELDRAAELADESTVSEILAAIEELCRERCE